MIIQIAKAELRNLFYSPVAWFLILAFLVQCAWFYTDLLVPLAEVQDMMIRNKPGFSGDKASYTRILFMTADGVFMNVLRNLYLFIPLLTMGLIGKEVQQGTFRLLYSSPVKLRQIVLGKYLAIMIYNMLLVMIVGIFMVSASFSMIEVDYGMLLSASLGFFLLTCAYAAIGTFMSSITTHQIIAAISTFLIVFCLSFIGNVWQKYDLVRDLTYFLHLPGRTEKMLRGLITTKDVVYFLVIVAMFLGFTILRLRAAREARPWYVGFLRYSVVVISGLLIGYVSSRPALTGYWDTTAQNVNTIHEKTQQLIKELGDEPLEVTLYANFFGPNGSEGFPERRNFYLNNVWEPYVRFKPDIKFRFVNYYDHDSSILSKHIYYGYPGKSLDYIFEKNTGYLEMDTADFLKPAQIRQMINLRPEKLRLVMQLKYKGRTEFLRTYTDNRVWPNETHVAAALKRLIQGTAPKVAFVTGHYERHIYKTGEREYGAHTALNDERQALVNLGFDADTISLDREDIPADLTMLVLADPKSALSTVCLEKIRRYISQGGNMIITGEPGKQQMVNPVLKQLGVSLMDGALVTQWEHETPDKQAPVSTDAYHKMLISIMGSLPLKPGEVRLHMGMAGVTAIDYADTAGFTITPMLLTEKGKVWLKKGKLVTDSARVEFNKEEGDLAAFFRSRSSATAIKEPESEKPAQPDSANADHANNDQGAFVTMLALERKVNNKDQKIIVAGDADFMSNKEGFQRRLIIPLYSWLAGGVYPVYLPDQDPPDNLLTITGKTAAKMKIFYVWILPAIVLLGSAVLLIRRKRK